MFLSRFSIICLIGHWSWKIYINCPSSKPLPCSFPPGLSSPLPQALPHCLPQAPIQLFILLYPPTCVPPIPTYLYLCQLSRFCKLSLYLHHSLCPESCPHPLSTQPHTPLSCGNFGREVHLYFHRREECGTCKGARGVAGGAGVSGAGEDSKE